MNRNTFEAKIKLLQFDAQEPVDIQTGVGFHHMLTLFARHGRMSCGKG